MEDRKEERRKRENVNEKMDENVKSWKMKMRKGGKKREGNEKGEN